MHGAQIVELITCSIGKYVCYDEKTSLQTHMDVARILVKTKYCLVLIQTFNEEVNTNVYRIKMVKDNHGPKRIAMAKEN